MKKHYIICLITILALLKLNAQDCSIGNNLITEEHQNINLQSNRLYGVKYTLFEEGTLNSINLIGTATNASVQMAVYDDNNGVPNNLVATSNIGIVNEGLVSLQTPSVLLSPGDYWVFANYDASGTHTLGTVETSGNTYYYSESIAFGDSMPSNASTFNNGTDYGLTLLYFLDITCSSSVQNECITGNFEVSPEFDTFGISANYLLGTKHTLSQPGTLNAINYIGNGTGAQVQMVVYDDNNGVPNNLMRASSVRLVLGGRQSIRVIPVDLPAGDYWIMAFYDVPGNHSNVNTNATGNDIYYKSLAFGSPLPFNASDFSTFSGQDFLYALEVTCIPQTDCSIGNYNITPDYTEYNIIPNRFLGVKHTLTEEGTLNSINFIGNNTGANVQMAVYDDLGNSPYNLVATSEIGTVGDGMVALPVTPVVLQPGDYWIMANYDSDGNHSNVNTNASSSRRVYHFAHNFDDPLPSQAINLFTYTGQDYLYYLDITCGSTLSTPDLEINNDIKLYPNPSSNIIKISGLKQKTYFSLYDHLGRKIFDNKIENNEAINIQNLNTGLYFIRFENGQTKKFIKK
ncbi:T9SS type A sorting domain-containing protein [Psychroserpens damuponensis]|uniref:T9SS type A sorting domain-containing protein n=1 Tax=Psychroserpens damuponensis TaxID=943936 RepID=UPI0006935147|nr:T9SS type A sorting domain-containing protein [Psychroserpens damuponensis]